MQNNKAKNILVTGGAGFIGSHLIEKLLKQGHKVVCIDNLNDYYDLELKETNLQSIADSTQSLKEVSGHFIFYKIDICDLRNLRPIFAENNFEVVVHLAGRAGVRPSLENPEQYVQSNISGTVNLLELCREYKIPKFIFGSSSSVYGSSPEQVPFSETQDCTKPISQYAATKSAGEQLCHVYNHLYGIKIICLRFFTVYGPRQRPDLAIHKFAKLISANQEIPVFGNGSTSRDYTYITDILQGITAAVDDAELSFEIINLGGSKTVTLTRLIKLLETNLNKKAKIKTLPAQPGDVPITFANVSKAKQLLGYNPNTPIEEGIKLFCEWFLGQTKQSSEPQIKAIN
jgi:UDP-glucuronate 4-epimerase